jgi:hypothetical protein
MLYCYRTVLDIVFQKENKESLKWYIKESSLLFREVIRKQNGGATSPTNQPQE